MIDIEINITSNLPALRENFNSAVRDGLRQAMFYAEAKSKGRFNTPGNLHVRSGTLRRSINSKVEDYGDTLIGKLGSNVIYARVHELGAVIRPRASKYLKFQVNGKWVSVKQAVIPARPFLRPAIEENIDRMANIIKDEVMRKLQ